MRVPVTTPALTVALALALALPLVGCSEWSLDPRTDVERPRDTDDGGGGAVVDRDCELASAPEGLAVRRVGCPDSLDPLLDPWRLRSAWEWEDPDEEGIVVMPVVAPLVDDNDDGRVDGSDRPRVVAVTLSGRLVVLDGATGALEAEREDLSAGGLAIGDIDEDGTPEIISIDREAHVLALRADGTALWRSAEPIAETGILLEFYPSVADLEGDGSVEVLVNGTILEGADGSLRARSLRPYQYSHQARAADLDLDGVQEAHFGDLTLTADGQFLERRQPGLGDRFVALVDVDGDPEPEVAWTEALRWGVHELDGTVLVEEELDDLFIAGRAGPPAVGDFDGDGQLEIAVAARETLGLWELDGQAVWTAPIEDRSGSAGPAGFDLDGDGAMEVIYADESRLMVLDGRTGERRMEELRHGSRTGVEVPVVADVDGDGAAEIVTASNRGGFLGVMVTEHDGEGWMPAGRAWTVHDFRVDNAREDGAVVQDPPTWQTHGLVRARPVDLAQDIHDLGVELVDHCWSACESGGRVRASIRVLNHGSETVEAGIEVALQSEDGQVLDTVLLEEDLPPGARSASLSLEAEVEASGLAGVRVEVDAQDRELECDASNNVVLLPACPGG